MRSRVSVNPESFISGLAKKIRVQNRFRIVSRSDFRDPAGTRTQGPYINSVLLYQLSYEIACFLFKGVQMY